MIITAHNQGFTVAVRQYPSQTGSSGPLFVWRSEVWRSRVAGKLLWSIFLAFCFGWPVGIFLKVSQYGGEFIVIPFGKKSSSNTFTVPKDSGHDFAGRASHFKLLGLGRGLGAPFL